MFVQFDVEGRDVDGKQSVELRRSNAEFDVDGFVRAVLPRNSRAVRWAAMHWGRPGR